jgi:malonate-semialdehyde dehydrogenase (acetylating)/methylmalonate-semialdehyde dehydrogenase
LNTLIYYSKEWIKDIIPMAKALKVGAGNVAGTDICPVVDAAAKARIEDCITRGVAEGATLLVDGRGAQVEGYPNGHFVGPTLFTDVKKEHAVYQEEIFGPGK